MIERYSRITGLNGIGISKIQFDNATGKLVVAYDDSNIDILYRNDIINIPDITRDNITGDKSIRQIHIIGDKYYLATGLGIIVLDEQRYEVSDTWLIGDGGNKVGVNAIANDVQYIYAATEEGLRRAPFNSSSLADYSNWQLLSGSDGLQPGSCDNIISLQGKIIAQQNDSLFAWNGSTWDHFYSDGRPIFNLNTIDDKIIISEQKPTARIIVLNSNGQIEKLIENPVDIHQPMQVVFINGRYWIADRQTGLVVFDENSTFERIVPNSPASVSSGAMIATDRKLYVAAGTVSANWQPSLDSGGIYFLENGNWTQINKTVFPQLDSVSDIISIAIDPVDKSVWAGSFGGGLVKSGSSGIQVFKQGYLDESTSVPSSYRVAGLAFDNDHNLWISNYGAASLLKVKTTDGEFLSFTPPFSVVGNAVADIVVDDFNYKWIITPGSNGLLVYDHGASLQSSSDDRWKWFGPGAGNGNLPGSEVLSVAKDKNNFIWVGTNDGVAVFQCPQDIFSVSCDAVWPVVQRGNFAGYLFKGEQVNAIAIDGANRKWVGTNNGAWLVSMEGEQVISRFTAANSPLLSNEVRKIAIDPVTGEVYFSTSMGICSFRGTATEGAEENNQVLVFPNPVPPGYSGTIGIRGLVNNSILKITELNGRLVYQTRALGGQAVWDGRDYRGRNISTGVYLVVVSNDERTEKTVSRIVFISK